MQRIHIEFCGRVAALAAFLLTTSLVSVPSSFAGTVVPPVENGSVERIVANSEVFTVERQAVARTVPVSGTLVARHMVTVSARVAGIAIDVPKQPGDRVEVGDLLLSLDTEDLELQFAMKEAALQSAQASLVVAENNLKRQKALEGRGVASASALEDAMAELRRLEASTRMANAELDAARLGLARARITAPISGIIASRTVEPGQLVGNGQAVFTMLDPENLLLEAVIPFSDSIDIKVGMRADLGLPQAMGERLEAVVERINPEVDRKARSATVWLDILGDVKGYRPGSFLTGSIETMRSGDLLLVPASALVEAGKVGRIRDGRYEQIEVLSGQEWPNELVEITGPISVGDTLLRNPMKGLDAGDPVKLIGEQ
ncbi:efflux RND transporter periplasmic adaptor subunit [Paracoccus litorisediminis]|uniref:efflux RND transporter periplasmic adaptor subunit n=1 Tax=Paracoccus litorisediminis TaxID=2006130 RepID=UPI003730BBC0